MTDYEFNLQIKKLIDKCNNYTLTAYDIGDLLSGIYGIAGTNSVRIRILLPIFLKLVCDILADESVVEKESREFDYFVEKFISDFKSLDKKKREQGCICDIITIMSDSNLNSPKIIEIFNDEKKELDLIVKALNNINKKKIIDSIKRVLTNSELYSDPSLCMYRCFFTYLRDDIEGEGVNLQKSITDTILKIFESTLNIR